MNESLSFYQDQAKAAASNIPWVNAMQTAALNFFSNAGFPGRKDEEWKYTAVQPFLEKHFSETKDISSSDIRFPLKDSISIINGQISIPDLGLPETVIVMPLAEALREHADIVQKHWADYQYIHSFHALNATFLNTGIFIFLPAGVHLETPLHISHYQDADQGAHYLKHLIIAEADSALTLVEDYSGAPGKIYFTNRVTDIVLAKNAKLSHIHIQRESKAALHIGLTSASQAEGSQLDSHVFSIGGKLVRSDLDIRFNGENAQCAMNGVYVPGEGQHIDHHTSVHHNLPHCSSRQDYKGILTGHSKAVFNGKIIVAQDAQQTSAKQQNKNLLLSAGAEINTKPQLEIFADEVLCSHGATVGQLDEDALFYLATRGIGREEAIAFLVHAFAAENLQQIPHAFVGEWMHTLLDEQLGL